MKLAVLKALLGNNSNGELIENSNKYAKDVCFDLGIKTDCPVRKKEKQGTKSNDVAALKQNFKKIDMPQSIVSFKG